MHRRLMDPRVRVAILVLLFLPLALSSYGLYRAYRSPVSADREVTLASYAQTGNLDYSVSLKPNTLYDNASRLGPGRTYFSKLANSVDTIFYYDLSGSGIGKVSGTYQLVASLSTDVWEKNYTIIPRTAFSGEGGANFQVPFSVNLSRYTELVTSLGNEVGVPAKESNLKLVYSIESNYLAGGRELKESFSPVVSIPIGKGMFEVGGDMFSQRSGAVKATESYVQQDVLDNRWYYLNTSFLLLFLLAAFALLTEGKRLEIDVPGTAGAINKRYGEWIVGSKEVPNVHKGQRMMPLLSIDDLVKVADELGKPILHSENGGKHLYCVYDGQLVYSYHLN